ncbi:hypothetical protein SBDP1_530013 [Syntrophobacter sp. SbD1]|nr:hypothetical protein SBDP1_530013 [Syntrophobacter sp. SbD1]
MWGVVVRPEIARTGLSDLSLAFLIHMWEGSMALKVYWEIKSGGKMRHNVPFDGQAYVLLRIINAGTKEEG